MSHTVLFVLLGVPNPNIMSRVHYLGVVCVCVLCILGLFLEVSPSEIGTFVSPVNERSERLRHLFPAFFEEEDVVYAHIPCVSFCETNTSVIEAFEALLDRYLDRYPDMKLKNPLENDDWRFLSDEEDSMVFSIEWKSDYSLDFVRSEGAGLVDVWIGRVVDDADVESVIMDANRLILITTFPFAILCFRVLMGGWVFGLVTVLNGVVSIQCNRGVFRLVQRWIWGVPVNNDLDMIIATVILALSIDASMLLFRRYRHERKTHTHAEATHTTMHVTGRAVVDSFAIVCVVYIAYVFFFRDHEYFLKMGVMGSTGIVSLLIVQFLILGLLFENWEPTIVTMGDNEGTRAFFSRIVVFPWNWGIVVGVLISLVAACGVLPTPAIRSVRSYSWVDDNADQRCRLEMEFSDLDFQCTQTTHTFIAVMRDDNDTQALWSTVESVCDLMEHHHPTSVVCIDTTVFTLEEANLLRSGGSCDVEEWICDAYDSLWEQTLVARDGGGEAMLLIMEGDVPNPLSSNTSLRFDSHELERAITESFLEGMVKCLVFITVVSMVWVGVSLRSVWIPIRMVLTSFLPMAFVLVVSGNLLGGEIGTGALLSAMPLIYGVSLDYDMLLLHAILELRLKGKTTEDATVAASSYSNTTIWAAGALMVGVFCTLVLSPIPSVRHMGVLVCVGVLVDVVLIRTLLVPACLNIAQRLVWWPRRFEEGIEYREGFDGTENVIELGTLLPEPRFKKHQSPSPLLEDQSVP